MTTYRTFFEATLPLAVRQRLDTVVAAVVNDDHTFTDRGPMGYSNSAKMSIIGQHLNRTEVDLLTASFNYPEAVEALLRTGGESAGTVQLISYVADLRRQIIRRLRTEAGDDLSIENRRLYLLFESLEMRAAVGMRSLLLTFSPSKVETDNTNTGST